MQLAGDTANSGSTLLHCDHIMKTRMVLINPHMHRKAADDNITYYILLAPEACALGSSQMPVSH